MLMNSWHSEFVRENYAQQWDKWLIYREDGTISIKVDDSNVMTNTTRIPMAGEFGWFPGGRDG